MLNLALLLNYSAVGDFSYHLLHADILSIGTRFPHTPIDCKYTPSSKNLVSNRPARSFLLTALRVLVGESKGSTATGSAHRK